VTAAVGQVHRAATAAEACAQVVAVCRASAAPPTRVKAKSMLTEEIGLNDALAAAGVDTVGDRSGRVTIVPGASAIGRRTCWRPAVHLNARQIAELFERESGRAFRPRRHPGARRLRTRSAGAALPGRGGSGLPASTSPWPRRDAHPGRVRGQHPPEHGLPRVHVAVMGIEKIVRDWAGAAHLIQLLPLAAARRARSGVAVARSPARPATATTGPKELPPRCSWTTGARRCAAPSTRTRTRHCHPLRRLPVRMPRCTGRSAGTPTASTYSGPIRCGADAGSARAGPPRAATSCPGSRRCAAPARRPARSEDPARRPARLAARSTGAPGANRGGPEAALFHRVGGLWVAPGRYRATAANRRVRRWARCGGKLARRRRRRPRAGTRAAPFPFLPAGRTAATFRAPDPRALPRPLEDSVVRGRPWRPSAASSPSTTRACTLQTHWTERGSRRAS